MNYVVAFLEWLMMRYGVSVSTVLLLLWIVITATLLDYLCYSWLLGVKMYDGWFYGDIVLSMLVGGPILYLLLSLLDKSQHQQKALNDALSQVKELKELLPICSGCRRIRDESGAWQEADIYIREHTNAKVSHGFCPDCLDHFKHS